MWGDLLRWDNVITGSLLYIASEWAIRLLMTPIVMRHRRPSTAMAWLLVIFFQPWIGLALYWLIGGHRLPKHRIRRHQESLRHLESLAKKAASRGMIERPALDAKQAALVRVAEALGEMPVLGGNDVTLLTETNDVVDRLVDDIDAARRHVHLLYYIFADDETGRRVADAVARANARGVDCRLLVDAVGSWRSFKRLAPWLQQRGVEMHPMLPVSFFRRRLARMDLRNHRKLAVIDGEIAYTGSQNVVNASYGHKDLAWHDLTVRLTGPGVLALQGVFVEDWYAETGELLHGDQVFPAPRAVGGSRVQVLPSGPTYKIENYQRLVVAAVNASERHVVITTPYFVPDEPLMQALQTAVLRGVRVEIIVPARCDQITVGAAGRAYYEDLLEYGVALHLYQDGLLHAKTMSVDDDLALIGSGNFDIRSFYLNFELNLLFYGAEDARRLRATQERYIADSRRLTKEEWRQRPYWRQLLDDTGKLFSPLL